MKYTLCCKPGENLTPGLHYLIPGKWCSPSGMIVLQHGIMTIEKATKLCRSNGRVSVFYDSRYHTLSVDNTYDDRYYKRQQSDEKLQQFVGFLYWNNGIYEGRLNLK